ncbi:MAG TPA: NAD(P)H-hydrate epimerase [Candidatus Binatia bacterium]|nr:NAD(P)H-hydrate epimerase [Candidatus Binatia bacterium]
MSAAADRLRLDYGDLTGPQQTALDRAAGELGVDVIQLMEVAGWQVARWIFLSTSGVPIPILVVSGHGNNGGDGLVAARHLWSWGFAVEVALVAEAGSLGAVVAKQLRAVQAIGLPVVEVPGGELPLEMVQRAHLVVDALLGTGVRGDPRPQQAAAIRRMPPERTVSIDIPSGLDATAGTAGQPTVRALRTCTLTAMKTGLWGEPGGLRAGEITVADIGMPARAWRSAGLEPPRLVRGGALLRVPDEFMTPAAET